MRQVKILSGISGSGKSTLTRKLWNALEPGTYCKVVSADSYFEVDGVYTFDPTKLSDAHGACFRDFIHTVSKGTPEYDLVIVDNTNLSSEEIAPYILGAQAYGWEVEVLTLRVESKDLPRLVERNTHGVSEGAILAQYNRLYDRRLMPWWKNTDISVEV